jgi:plastocyanin
MRSKLVRLAMPVLALALVGAACSKSSTATTGGGGSSSGGGTITINGKTANDHGTKDFSGMSSASVEMNSFYFNPTVIKGTAGQTLQLKFENESSALHNFTLDGKDTGDVQAGQNATFTVTFPQSGILEFHCKYHQSSGMVGELTV